MKLFAVQRKLGFAEKRKEGRGREDRKGERERRKGGREGRKDVRKGGREVRGRTWGGG